MKHAHPKNFGFCKGYDCGSYVMHLDPLPFVEGLEKYQKALEKLNVVIVIILNVKVRWLPNKPLAIDIWRMWFHSMSDSYKCVNYWR